jgi:hypothetical protein
MNGERSCRVRWGGLLRLVDDGADAGLGVEVDG